MITQRCAVDDDEHVHTKLGRLDERVNHAHEKLDHIEKRLDLYTLLSRYLTTERIVFALIAVLSTSVVVAMVSLVLRK